MAVVDLTHPMHSDMPVMTGISPPRFDDIAQVEQDGYAMSQYHFVNHTGTHVDAPAHQILGGATLDDLPLERFVTDALTIDFSVRAPGEIPLGELAPHLDEITAGDIVLIRSGNSANWGTERYWHGWSYPGAEASRALIARGVVGVGFDGPSADPVESQDYELHHVWLSAGCYIIENLADLELLPRRCRLVVAPLKAARANGAPARVLGFPG
ncbi:MAG: cyclase family protein [Acidimicrobiales bacterium]